jgi:peptidoglycan/LPS O-acetylase OafA/YrhL
MIRNERPDSGSGRGLRAERRDGYIPALDGLRGAAVILVMLYHFVGTLPRPQSSLARLLSALSMGGWVGVDLFFVLSGFLITGILLRAKSGQNYFLNFYARRFLRIFPLYYAALSFLFFVVPRFVPLDAGSRRVYALQGWLWTYAANIETAMHGQFDFTSRVLDLAHLWSLSVEEHFYFIWPLVVWSLGERAIFRVSAGVCLLVPVLRCTMLAAHVFPGTVYTFTLCRIDALTLGALVALLARRPGGLAAVGGVARWAGAISAAFLAVIFGLRHSLDQWHWSMTTLGYSMVDLGAAALLVPVALGAGVLHRIFAGRLLRTVGKYSYGVYVVHCPLHLLLQIAIYDKLVTRMPEAAALAIHAVLSSATCVGIAMVVWHVLERPFLELKRFFQNDGAAILSATRGGDPS